MKNPFDFKKGRNKGKNLKVIKRKATLVEHEASVGVVGKDKDSHEKNAEKIVESAEYMGLDIIGGKAVAIQSIAKQLKDGKL